MRVPQSPQGTSLSPCIPSSPLQCHGDAPSDLTGFLLLPGWGGVGKDPLRSSPSPGLASLLWPALRISLSPPLSILFPALLLQFISFLQLEETFKSANLIPVPHHSYTVPYLQKKSQ